MITYYSDIIGLKSINNPLLDNSVSMRHSNFFEIEKEDEIPYFGTALKKTLHNQGRIFCDDSSKLFSISQGYVGLIISFPFDISNGVLFSTRLHNEEYLLWGVNVGQLDIGNPGIGVFLTSSGIEFRVKTSSGSYSLTDDQTNIMANRWFEAEFLWNKDGISDVNGNPNMIIRIDKKDVVGGIVSIADDSIVNNEFYNDIGGGTPPGIDVFNNIPFQLLDNSYKLNNLQCSLSRIRIEDSV